MVFCMFTRLGNQIHVAMDSMTAIRPRGPWPTVQSLAMSPSRSRLSLAEGLYIEAAKMTRPGYD